MRIIIVSALCLLVAGVVIVLAAGDGGSSSRGRETVAASFYPLAFAASEIGGESVEVENLTPPGAEPHDLEPTPRDVEDVQSADLVLLLGHDFQPSLESAAGNAGGEVIELLDTPGLDLNAQDPHVWLDPRRFAAIGAAIGKAMGKEAAARSFVRRLEALDREYRAGLSACERRDVVTSHEAFGYLADRYGLRQVAISGISPEVEPAPGDLQGVVEVIRETGATTVFTEPLVSPRLAQTVAGETGGSTAVLDPLEGLTPEEESSGEDYFTVMRRNLAALEDGLGCR
ncbi:MAG: zinc ABC transporter substrate-binding protein [Actinomycetota bacterium]